MAIELAFIFALIIFIFYFMRISTRTHDKINLPPMATGSWPIIGHMGLLAGRKLPHLVLGDLADKYGPIFAIKLGVHRALVVSSWEIAKECFTKHDKSFCNRPRSMAVEHMCYNSSMFGFAPYGPYWRKMRRITTLELLSNHRLAALSYHRESAITSSLLTTYNKWVEKKNSSAKLVVEMKRWFSDLTLDVIFRIVAGKSFMEVGNMVEGEQCKKAIRDSFALAGVFTVGDSVPFLRHLDIGGYEKEMKKVGKELDIILSGWLAEHKENRKNKKTTEEQDFMDIMLSILDNSTTVEPSKDVDTINKATCLSLTLGGTDSTTSALIWALTLLLNNPLTLKKAQDELDTYVGRDRQLQESDIKNLQYLQAVVKETFRLCPPNHFTSPRESVEDCCISGYHVPAGTRFFVNLYKLHRDPRVWSDPFEFRPERFLTTNSEIDVRGQNFELLPFGSGRRICPGVSFSMQVIQFTLGSLLHSFDVGTLRDEQVDMTQVFGITNFKALPLDVTVTPRLSAQLYG